MSVPFGGSELWVQICRGLVRQLGAVLFSSIITIAMRHSYLFTVCSLFVLFVLQPDTIRDLTRPMLLIRSAFKRMAIETPRFV